MDSKLVDMYVDDVVMGEDHYSAVVVLTNHNGLYKLPINIGRFEAEAIARELDDCKGSRPLTHDLLVNTITALDGDIQTVEITSFSDGIYVARIEIEALGETVYVDARPSDAIVLALKTENLIYVNQEVLNEVCAPKVAIDDTEISLKVPNIKPMKLKALEPDEDFNSFIRGLNASDFKLNE